MSAPARVVLETDKGTLYLRKVDDGFVVGVTEADTGENEERPVPPELVPAVRAGMQGILDAVDRVIASLHDD